MDVGLLLSDEFVTDTDKTNSRKICVNFSANATYYLMQNLPFNVNLVRHAQDLNPAKRTDVKSSNVISNLALKVGKNLEYVLSNVFPLEPHEKVKVLCGKISGNSTNVNHMEM